MNSDSNSEFGNEDICSKYSDNKFIGKKFDCNVPDDQKIFRIQGCNPNGFRLSQDGGDFNEFCTDMREYGIDVSCVSELNLDTTNFKIRNILCDTGKKHFQQKVYMNMSSSSIRTKNFYKPGGVLMLTTGNYSGRIVKSGSDRFGRWTYQYFSCKNNKCIVIITAYQPCVQNLYHNRKLKSSTVTAQQTSMLMRENDDRLPRIAFIEDLNKFVSDIKANGDNVILLGDFNESLYKSNSGMKKIMTNNNLCDLMWKFLQEDEFSTYINGSKRIDYALVDFDIYDCVLNACYEPFKYRNKGDHRTMVLDFDADALFGNPTYNLFTPLQREINSKDTDVVQKYCTSRFEYLNDHKFGERLRQVQQNWDPVAAEALDKDFQRACIQASASCKKKPNIAYVRQISQLRAKKNVLQKLISGHRLKKNFDKQIALSMLGTVDFIIPDTVDEWKKELREVQKKIKQLQKDATMLRKNEIEDLILAADATGDKETSKMLRRKIKAKETKQMFQKIKYINVIKKKELSYNSC